MSAMLCTGATFVLKEKLLISYLMPESGFIWFFRSRSTYFPYFRAIAFEYITHDCSILKYSPIWINVS